ncbi:adrenodoxin-like protein 2, mitochondrial isoform X2 [Asterias rubens]|uniref:adrenodoxin-like protein 2, mitochondrial isoform X2 n=1 Tax=Asterias rubens TaxID=7604 RepID=UPI001455630E|nr:adrenodoxin-like protein 2, mitochondrial isoform X2 [Asterias rubens]
MASVFMKTFPSAFRSLVSSSVTSRLQLLNNTYRTFEERLGSPSLSPCSPVSTGMLSRYSSSCNTCSSLKWHCLSSSNDNRLPVGIKGKHTFAHIGPCRSFSLGVPASKKRELDGEKLTVKTSTGQNLLDVVIDNDLDIDGYGACEGTLSCSTCHLFFSEELFKNLPKPSDEELDMLDLAYGQTDTSRLGCQVVLTKDMDGMTFVVPDGVSDARDV